MKYYASLFLVFLLFVGCTSDASSGCDFTPQELKEEASFLVEKISEGCLEKESFSSEPLYRVECSFYFYEDEMDDIISAGKKDGWRLSYTGSTGCGYKYYFRKTVDGRDLFIYFRNEENAGNWFCDDGILLRVEYDEE